MGFTAGAVQARVLGGGGGAAAEQVALIHPKERK